MTVYTSINRVDVETITHAEILEYAKECASDSVNWMGYTVTCLAKDRVVVTTATGTQNFTPNDILVTSEFNGICSGVCLCKLTIFNRLFYLAEEDKQ